MPVSFLEVPTGLGVDAKRKLVHDVFVALDAAYRVPDTRIFIREWPPESVSQDGRLDSHQPRPVAFLDVPPGIENDAKRTLVRRISAAVTEAYHLSDVLIFIREHRLDLVSLDGGLQSENPLILAAMQTTAGTTTVDRNAHEVAG